MRVRTVILNWRTPDMTLRALDAARIAMRGVDGDIVVVDNASGDGSEARITAAIADMEGVHFVQSGRNGGFGAGNNAGIRAPIPGPVPEAYYILNSDAFPAPEAIRVLHDYLVAVPGAGFAGSLIHGPDGETHLTTFRFPGILSEIEGSIRFGPVSRLLTNSTVPLATPSRAGRVDWLAGASLMMRAEVLAGVGLFDETFFLYFEETDLCLRAARAGHEVHFVPDSRVAHIGSVSTGMKEWSRVPGYWFASRWYYFARNHGRAYAVCATAAHVAGGAFHRLRSFVTGKRPADPPRFLRMLIAHDLAALFRPLPSVRPAPKPVPLRAPEPEHALGPKSAVDPKPALERTPT